MVHDTHTRRRRRREIVVMHGFEAVVLHVYVVCVQLFPKIDFGTYFVYHNELLVVSAAVLASFRLLFQIFTSYDSDEPKQEKHMIVTSRNARFHSFNTLCLFGDLGGFYGVYLLCWDSLLTISVKCVLAAYTIVA